uniref:Leukocyte elastase inhibitor-like n=1 Tax=Fundulus heteroclitus TaxID=8078 RepID=A0A3Q2PNU9_FUNHE
MGPSLHPANTSFSLALLRKLSEDNKTANIFFSPFSISSALAMVMLGARGNTATQISELEKHLTYENFMEWTHPDKMKISGLEVMLPRFKLEEAYDLKEVLSSMGMKDAFDETKCDFFGMSGCKELFLSKVSHKAFVEVNEEGTEAAATTWFGENLCGRPMFLASNPFLFFIRHNPTMSVLFAGRFCYPVEDLSPSEELFEW